MHDLFDEALIWRQFESTASAHIEVSSLCSELESEGIQHRIVEIIPLASAALAVMLVQKKRTSSLANWQSSTRARQLTDVLYSLGTPDLGANESIWVFDLKQASELLAFCDHAIARGGTVLDLQLNRTGPAGGCVFLRAPEEILSSLEETGRASIRTSGRLPLAGDYRRYWL